MTPVLVNIEELRAAFAAGRLPPERLFAIIEQQQQAIVSLQQISRGLSAEVDRLRQRLAQYEPQIDGERRDAPAGGGASAADYSLQAEEKRRRPRKRRKKSPGRRPGRLKFADAQQFEKVYPPGIPRRQCRLIRQRPVWRVKNGQAVLVGYRVFGLPGKIEGPIPGVTPRCEFGLEVLVILAFLVYVVRISLDKACAVLRFFCQLPLSKSQADALLRQLARHWENDFDALCEALAYAAVVYTDGTGWKVGQDGASLSSFATEFHRVFLFGCRQDGDTLKSILPPDAFRGVLVSDDGSIYRKGFTFTQKCWAHLLRKAIRLKLLYPRERKYGRFLDCLLAIYGDAKRAAADGRLGDKGRARRVDELEIRVRTLCEPYAGEAKSEANAKLSPPEKAFRNLARELLRLLDEASLFTFVEAEGVEPTNNLSERLLRGAAEDRKCGRTNKTPAGAHRRSVIVSVLESLRANLPQFHLQAVLAEVAAWATQGVSLFRRQRDQLAAEAAALDSS